MKVSPKSAKFLWLGNSPALDFVNTQLVQAGVVTDLLASGKDFLLWLREADFLPAETAAKQSGAVLELAVAFARQYRAQLRKGLEQLAAPSSVPDSVIAATNELLVADAHAVRILRRGKRFDQEAIWRFREPATFCAPIAYSFADLLSIGDLSRVRRCKNPQCFLFFYDTSKSGTRSWCSLNICGNRLRIEAFRKRHKREL